MNDVTDIFAARAATLPLAPRQALCPAFSADPTIREIHDCLCDLHHLAFRALHGPPPTGVQVRRVHSGLANEVLEPRYLATLRREPVRMDYRGWTPSPTASTTGTRRLWSILASSRLQAAL